MADLLAHVAFSRVAVARVRDPALVLLVLAGTILPDLVSKFLIEVVETGSISALPSHTILGTLILAYAGSLFLEPALRLSGMIAIFTGEALHLALDALKRTPAEGVEVLFPFSDRAMEAGLFLSEDSIFAAPIALFILLFFTWRGRAR